MTQQAPLERITLLFEKFSGFVDGYGENLSLGGMFLETEDHREVGSIVDFAVKLTDGFQLLYGLGEVVWTRHRAGGPDLPAGLGIRFQALDDNGRELILKILEERVSNGYEPFDVEEIPPDVAGLASDPFEEPVVDDPFAADEPVPVTSASPTSEAATSPPAPGLADAPAPHPVPPDLEKKILGEDGFTLIDSEQREPDPAVAPDDETFEELAFDAPWGEALPELPEEVLEEDSFVTATEDSTPAPAAADASESLLAAEEVPEPTFGADELSEPESTFGADDFPEPESTFGADDFPEPEATFGADEFAESEATFGAGELPEPSFAAEEMSEPSFDADELPEASFATSDVLEPSFEEEPIAEASAEEAAEDSYAARELATFIAEGGSEPSFALEEDSGLDQGVGADFGSAASVDEEGEQDPLEASLYLAAEAADEIDTTPPSDEVFDEPDFHEIDFGASASEDLAGDAAPGAVSEDFAFGPDSGSTGASADFAFEPDPEDQLPPLEMDSLAPAADDNAFALAEETSFADVAEDDPFALDPPGVISGESTGDDPFDLDEEDATLVGASQRSSLPLDSEDATVVGSGASNSVDPVAPAPTEAPWKAGATSFEDFAPDAPPLAPAEISPVAEAVPETPSLWAPGGIGSASEAEAPTPVVPLEDPAESIVTVAGAPAEVQDYEDDLFADTAGGEGDQAARRGLSGRLLALVAVLALALAGAYFFQDQLLGWVGNVGTDSASSEPLGPPPTEPSASDLSPPATSDVEPVDADPAVQPSDGAPAVEEVEPPPVAETTGDPESETVTPELEEVDVAETLPSGGAAVGDPKASPGVEPPTIEAAGPALAPPSARASRVEGITWRQFGGGTQVIVKLDGSLDESDYLHMPLGYNPAREMVRLTGISEPYGASQVEVGSPELLRIRTGYHVKAEGPELHVVFDFPNVGPTVTGVRHLGDRLEIQIARP